MHEMPDTLRSPVFEDAPERPDASSSRVPETDGLPPDPPRVALPAAWEAARREAQAYHPHPSAVWPRAWSSVGAWLAALLVLLVILAPTPPSVTNLYTAASGARASWRYDRALAFYQRAAQQDPADPRAHCLMGEVLALQQLYRQAVAAYTTCQRLGDRGGAVWRALGDLAQDQGDTQGAERAWLRAAALGDATARHRLGLLYEAQARFDLATAEWQRLPANDAVARVHLGLLALRTGDFAMARAEFIAARGLPSTAGQDAVDQGFVQLAAVGPSDPAGLTVIGASFIKAGMPTFARLPLQRALVLSPGSGPAHAYLAWVERVAGETAAAQADSAVALANAPFDSFALFVAAELALDAHQWSAGVGLLDQALQFDGKNAELWAERGRAEVALRDYLHAELSYQLAERDGTDPAFGQLYLDFYVQFHIGLDTGRAQAAALETTQHFAGDSVVWELAGQIYGLGGDGASQQAAFVLANQLDPSNPRPYLDLAQLAYAERDYDVATRDLRTGLALQPEGPLAEKFQAMLAVLSDFAV